MHPPRGVDVGTDGTGVERVAWGVERTGKVFLEIAVVECAKNLRVSVWALIHSAHVLKELELF